MSNIKIGSLWKSAGTVYVKVNGVWKIVSTTHANVGGTWKMTTLGAPPDKPNLSWSSTGVFRITNYNPTLYYEARLVGGSGTAALNSSGYYSLSGADSAFYVSAAYAQGAPKSVEAYMERKSRTTKTVIVGQECWGTNCVENRVATCNTNPGDPSYGGAQCPPSCPCYDGSQNRCICWSYGQPNPLCYGRECRDIYGDVDDTKWGGDPWHYTDRGTEWSKQS